MSINMCACFHPCPTGLETEGYNAQGDWNPETAYGLSYYIT